LSVAARAAMFRPELVEDIFVIDSLGGIVSQNNADGSTLIGIAFARRRVLSAARVRHSIDPQ
jgi:hypothetical protein